MMINEFFKNLQDAEYWASHDMKHRYTEVYGLDKRGTILAFISEKHQAINDGRKDAEGARAVVKVWH